MVNTAYMFDTCIKLNYIYLNTKEEDDFIYSNNTMNFHPEEEKEVEIENIMSIQTTTENQTKADDLVNNNLKDNL